MGRITTYSYDALDRQISATNPLGYTTTDTYDAVGNLIKTKDSLGNQTRYVYDALDRQVRSIDSLGGTTDTSYDAVGNLTSIIDAVGNRTNYTYDALDRLITETNQLGKTRTHTYDAVGNEIQTIDRNGRKTTYTYDALDRATSENWWDSNNTIFKTFNYSFDAVGHLVTAADSTSRYTYTFDPLDRITKIDNTGTVGVPAVIFNYAYDAVGNVINVSDSINGISAAVTTYTYDALDRVTRLTQAGNGVNNKRVDMAYNAVDLVTNISRYRDNNFVAETNFTYDNNQNLTRIAHQRGATVLASYDYSYDAGDRLTQTNSSNDGTSNYSYDANGQLIGADNTTQLDEAYSYDANGNRINSGYVTGGDNRLRSDGVYNYSYDDEGNRTQRVEISTGKVTEYNWDYRNRLTSVVFKDAGGNVIKTIEYLYDVNDLRIGKKIDGVVTERYAIDRDQIALVFDGNGSQTHRYFYGTQIDEILADDTNTGTIWALADVLGTVKDLIDDNGNVLQHLNYDSFGRVVSITGSVDFRFGYTGREWDKETGLNYYRARYYDANTGNFISVDPLSFAAGDTNLYRYVGNTPTLYTDPTGLFQIYKGNLVEDALTAAGHAYTAVSIVTRNPGGITSNPFYKLRDAIQGTEAVKKFDVDIKCRLGEDYAQAAVDYYQGVINDPNASTWQKAGAYVGGTFASAWTEETSNATFDVLSAAAGNAKGIQALGRKLDGLAPKWAAKAKDLAANLKPRPSKGGCFIAGTEIETLDGVKSIEDIQVGDWVLSDDPNTPGEIEYKQVLQTFIKQTTGLVDIYIDGEKITATDEHPFWVPDLGWVAAKDLQAGMLLQMTPSSSNAGRVSSSVAKKLSQTDRVVINLDKTTLTVEDLSNIIPRVNGIPNISRPLQEVIFVKNQKVVSRVSR